ncbi:hypothetical protein AHAS_Ahas02G0018200 [Arachis hypogaea]
MAEALVIGALVNGLANVVLDRLISSEFVNLVVGKKLDRKLVDRLKTAILAAKALAADAEQKQFGNELVREWLDGLKDALYNADDLLDRVFIKAQIHNKLTMLPNGMYNLVNLRHLNIRRTPLEKMPKGMGKLKQLHILSNFVVGKQEDNGIQELGGLLNLHGSLEIQKLEKVVDANEARSARIIDKKHIDDLLLKWSLSSGDVMASDAQTERDILHSLQPHNGLKELRIWGYKGTIFPDWLGDCSYQNMTSVSLKSCKNCCMLPSLGQLPSLQSLRIQSFSQLKSVGMEFYKNEGHQHSSPIAPFPSLERLEFHNMPCWEEWHLPDSEAFPQLKGLEIRDCRMLKGDMLNQVLMKIVFSSSDVSKVRQLKIQEDHQGWGKRMTLDRDSLSIHGFESVVEYAFKARIIHHLTSLQEVHISRCSQIELLQQQHKYDLVHLQIEKSCDSLTSLSLDAFPNLKNLQIDECSNLESISMSEPPHAALQRLSINYCHKFVSFPEEGLAAPNLTHLSVIKCLKLPEGGSPPNLKELSVGECEQQLTGLSWLGNLDNLTRLTISGNDPKSIIESYPEEKSCLPPSYYSTLRDVHCWENTARTSINKFGPKFPTFPPFKSMENKSSEEISKQVACVYVEMIENEDMKEKVGVTLIIEKLLLSEVHLRFGGTLSTVSHFTSLDSIVPSSTSNPTGSFVIDSISSSPFTVSDSIMLQYPHQAPPPAAPQKIRHLQALFPHPPSSSITPTAGCLSWVANSGSMLRSTVELHHDVNNEQFDEENLGREGDQEYYPSYAAERILMMICVVL